MKPSLSLLIPNYNHAHCLPRLLDSILAQSIKHIEVLVVDDCSNEPCAPVIEAYASKGLNIRLLQNQQRLYTKETRLRAIEAATSDIIYFADADDILWGTEALAHHVNIFREQQADIVHFRTVFIDELGTFTGFSPQTDPFAPSLEGQDIFFAFAKTSVQGSMALWDKLYSRALCLKSTEMIRQSSISCLGEDACMTILYMAQAKHYIGSERIGYAYHYVNKRSSEGALRSIADYHLLHETLPLLNTLGCQTQAIASLKEGIEKHLSICVGDVSLASYTNEGIDISSETIKKYLDGQDPYTFIKALLIGSRHNSKKVVDTYKTLLNL